MIELRQHNASFCSPCFLRHCREQVRRAIEGFDMFAPTDRVLVAVSGGKDSLGLWDMLLELGFRADGLYIGLGIGDDAPTEEPGAGYSRSSAAFTREFAARRGVVSAGAGAAGRGAAGGGAAGRGAAGGVPEPPRLIEVDLPAAYGFDIVTGAAAARRAPCSACGLSKRHLFNSAAIEGGYDAVATGHNLDDEAAVLMGNTLRWNTGYLGRQLPVLPGGDGFVRKVKPLVRLGEREMAAYCVLRGIDYIVEECPMSSGNRHLGYKEALNVIEEGSPGSKHAFYFEFLAKAAGLFQPLAAAERAEGMALCPSCGAPTTREVCAFCSLVTRASDPDRVAAVRVQLGQTRRRRRRPRQAPAGGDAGDGGDGDGDGDGGHGGAGSSRAGAAADVCGARPGGVEQGAATSAGSGSAGSGPAGAGPAGVS